MSYAIKSINDLGLISDVEKHCKALALADAILMPEWEYRYFSFNSNWDGCKQEMMASMRDGSGGEYFIHFTSEGVAGKVFYKELLPDPSNELLLVPDKFAAFKVEPAFSLDKASFFFWKEKDESSWKASPSNLREYPLLGFLLGGVDRYHCWAESYYERKIDLTVLKEVFSTLSITADQLSTLNPDIELGDLDEDLQEIL